MLPRDGLDALCMIVMVWLDPRCAEDASRQGGDSSEPKPDLFEIRLESIERDFDEDLEASAFVVEFHCDGPHGQAFATVILASERLATLEIVPRAMSDLHRLFAALAKQSQAWRIKAA